MKYGEKLLDRFTSVAKQTLGEANDNIILSAKYFDKMTSILLTPLPEPDTKKDKAKPSSKSDDTEITDAEGPMGLGGNTKPKPGKGLLSWIMSQGSKIGAILFGGAALMGGSKAEAGENLELKEIITKAEGTTDEAAKAKGFESAYDVPYGYGKYLKPDKPLSTMTLDEVDAFQIKLINATRGHVPGAKRTEGTSAVGKYQIIRPTLTSLTEDLPGSTIFSPQLQEKLGSKLIAQRIEQGGGNTKKTVLALSQEFASLPMDQSGRSFYGQPVGVSYDDLSQAVDKRFAADKIIKKFEAVMDTIKKGSNINNQGDAESDSATSQLVIVPINSVMENAGGSLPPAPSKSTSGSMVDRSGAFLLRLALNA